MEGRISGSASPWAIMDRRLDRAAGRVLPEPIAQGAAVGAAGEDRLVVGERGDDRNQDLWFAQAAARRGAHDAAGRRDHVAVIADVVVGVGVGGDDVGGEHAAASDPGEVAGHSREIAGRSKSGDADDVIVRRIARGEHSGPQGGVAPLGVPPHHGLVGARRNPGSCLAALTASSTERPSPWPIRYECGPFVPRPM